MGGLGVGMLPSKLVTCLVDAPDASAPVFVVRPAAGWLPRRARVVFDAVVTALKLDLGT